MAAEILDLVQERRSPSRGSSLAWKVSIGVGLIGLIAGLQSNLPSVARLDSPMIIIILQMAIMIIVFRSLYSYWMGANQASSSGILRSKNNSNDHSGAVFSGEQLNRRDHFNALRRASFPGPYPNGWYVLASSHEFVSGRPPLSFSVLGREIIGFRGANNHKIAVLEAHCPHLGAHLGIGSRVVGDCVECPFHQWKFDNEGTCRDIPYLPADTRPPAQARTHAYPVRELVGMVWIWYDAERGEPAWEPLIPESLKDGSMYFGGTTQLKFDMHISEMFENSADERHFNTLHAPFPLWPLCYFLNLRHVIKLDWPTGKPDGSHLCLFRESARVFLLDRVPVAPLQHTNIIFDGPTVMHFMMKTPVGRVHFLKSMIPVAPFRLVTEDRWWCDQHLPRWFGWLLARIGANALEQDRLVWENKIYRQPPTLVKGERPFSQHRQWYRQFYSQSSVRFPPAPEHNSLEW